MEIDCFNSKIVDRSIYIDFEGEGLTKNNHTPLPHMAGIFRPYREWSEGKYKAAFYRNSWQRVIKGSSKNAYVENFQNSIDSLIDEAKNRGGLIIYWSFHEENIIQKYAPDLFTRFKAISYNLLPKLRTLVNGRDDLSLNPKIDKVLNRYLKAIKPNSPLIVEDFHPGAAEACRRIDNLASKKWRKWNKKQKNYLHNLLEYNLDDLLATWRLSRYYGNVLDMDT